MSTHIVTSKNVLSDEETHNLKEFCLFNSNESAKEIAKKISVEFKIDVTTDKDIIVGYERDWSNMKGWAEALARPIDVKECSILLKISNYFKIPLTFSITKHFGLYCFIISKYSKYNLFLLSSFFLFPANENP